MVGRGGRVALDLPDPHPTAIAATVVDFVNASQLFATFDLSGATPGSYSLKVQQGAQSATATSTFHVVAVPSPAPLAVGVEKHG